MNYELTFLGTGSAFPIESYNACFILEEKTKDGTLLLADAGGGNGILKRLKICGYEPADIKNLFISHSHTDHILGAVWIIRSVINSFKEGNCDQRLNIYSNAETIAALSEICRLTLLPSHFELMKKIVNFHNVEVANIQKIGDTNFTFFDTCTRDAKQTGFKTILNDGKSFVFLGDEALTEQNAFNCRNADIVVCGAFCTDADANIFKPYEKHHHTVLEVAAIAERVGVKTLVIVHCEDTDLNKRQQKYAAEARKVFSGTVIVPEDGMRLLL